MTSPRAVSVDAAHDLHGLGRTLADAADGNPPPADHRTVHLTARPGLAIAGVFGFTAHHVVAAEVDHQWLRRTIGTDPFGAMGAEFVSALATQTGGVAGVFDTVLVVRGSGADPADVGLTRTTLAAHPRVRRASTYRRSIATYASPDGACVARSRQRRIAARNTCRGRASRRQRDPHQRRTRRLTEEPFRSAERGGVPDAAGGFG